MIKFVNFPPREPGDIEFSDSYRDIIGSLEISDPRAVEIGENIGRLLCANTNAGPRDFGMLFSIGYHLVHNSNLDGLWQDDNRIQFMQGLIDGMEDERSARALSGPKKTL